MYFWGQLNLFEATDEPLSDVFHGVLRIRIENPDYPWNRVLLMRMYLELVFMLLQQLTNAYMTLTECSEKIQARLKHLTDQLSARPYGDPDIALTQLNNIKQLPLSAYESVDNFYVGVEANLIDIKKYFLQRSYPHLRNRDAIFSAEAILAERILDALVDYHRRLLECATVECQEFAWNDLMTVALNVQFLLKIAGPPVYVSVYLAQLMYGTHGAYNFVAARHAFMNTRFSKHMADDTLGALLADILLRCGFELILVDGVPRVRRLLSTARQILDEIHRLLRQCRKSHAAGGQELSKCYEPILTTARNRFREASDDKDMLEEGMFIHTRQRFERCLKLPEEERTVALSNYAESFAQVEVDLVQYYEDMRDFTEDAAYVSYIQTQILTFLREIVHSIEFFDIIKLEQSNKSIEMYEAFEQFRFILQKKFDEFENDLFDRGLRRIFYTAFLPFLNALRAHPDALYNGLVNLRDAFGRDNPFSEPPTYDITRYM